jgi:hypothetical protein
VQGFPEVSVHCFPSPSTCKQVWLDAPHRTALRFLLYLDLRVGTSKVLPINKCIKMAICRGWVLL